MVPIKATIFILGADGFAYELSDYMKDLFQSATRSKFGLRSDSEIFFVSDDNPDVMSVKEYHNRISSSSGEYYSIMGLDRCDDKIRMQEKIVEPILSFIHPRAIKFGLTGPGTIVAPGAVLAPRSSLGKHVLCNYNAVVGRDARVGDYSVICPGVTLEANSTLGKGVYVGSNACIRENISIGDGAVIEAGTIVTEDVPPKTTIESKKG